MSKAPVRTLTVCEGRNTIGYINEMEGRQFLALLATTGENVGIYPTQADAAQAIDAKRKAQAFITATVENEGSSH